MTGNLAELIAFLLGCLAGLAACYAIQILPLWKAREIKARTVITFIACLTLLQGTGLLLLLHQFGNMDLITLNAYKTVSALPSLIFPFFVFRKRGWQNLFLLSIHLVYSITPAGLSNYAHDHWLSSFAYPLLTANFFLIVATAITLPFVLYVLRRLFDNALTESVSVFWRFFWLIPVLFFALTLMNDNYLVFNPDRDFSFVFARIANLAILLLVCLILDAALRQASENSKLREHARAAGLQLDVQREQYERIMQNARVEKALRHDLRHHMAVISQLAEDENAAKTKGYVDDLAGQAIAAQEKTYCTNYAANAIAAHYLRVAESEGIAVEAALKVPEDTGSVPAMDICVILGNFLENALEACRRMELGDRFIRVRSRIDGDTLSIVVTNSFNGVWREEDGAYLSVKGGELMGEGGSGTGLSDSRLLCEGIGLSSVKALCEKHRGLVHYEITKDVWKSSALVHMTGKGTRGTV